MSTRSQIIIKDKYDSLWFYRHSDGYPSENMLSLYKFMQWVDEKKIRSNVGQASGWLILIGAKEYDKTYSYVDGKYTERTKATLTEPTGEDFSSWKVGAYEPCSPERHGDIEWLYTINLEDNSIEIENINADNIKTYTFAELKKFSKNWEKLEK